MVSDLLCSSSINVNIARFKSVSSPIRQGAHAILWLNDLEAIKWAQRGIVKSAFFLGSLIEGGPDA